MPRRQEFPRPSQKRAAQANHGADAEPLELRLGHCAFAEMDQLALRVLPKRRYECTEWAVAEVRVEYHVNIGGHSYSVPCQHTHAQVEVCVTRATAEIFQRGQRMASHALCACKGRHTTTAAHMPAAHREMARQERGHADGGGRRRGTALRGAG